MISKWSAPEYRPCGIFASFLPLISNPLLYG